MPSIPVATPHSQLSARAARRLGALRTAMVMSMAGAVAAGGMAWHSHWQAQQSAQAMAERQHAVLQVWTEVNAELERAVFLPEPSAQALQHRLDDLRQRLSALPATRPPVLRTAQLLQALTEGEGERDAAARQPAALWLQLEQALHQDTLVLANASVLAAAHTRRVLAGWLSGAALLGLLGTLLLALQLWALPLARLRRQLHALASRQLPISSHWAPQVGGGSPPSDAPSPEADLQHIARQLEESERLIADFARRFASRSASTQWLELTRAIPGVVFQYEYLPDGTSVCHFVSPQVDVFFDRPRPANACAYASQAPDETATLAHAHVPVALTRSLSSRMAHIAHTQTSLAFDTQIRNAHDARWIRTLANVQPDANGSLLVSGVWLDVTDTIARDEALAQARLLAEQQASEKSRLLAVMSHEIRTPLNGVLGMTQLALKGELDDQTRQRLEKAQQAGLQLMDIVNDVLDYSKMESGQVQPEQLPFDLHALLAQSAELLAPRAAEKGLELWLDVAPDVPDQLLGDAYRTRQILTNYLSNSVKFTPAGDVCLRVCLAPPDDPGATAHAIRFEVHDTGIGLSTQQQRNLFRPFHQADDSITRRYGGTGLGLSISAELARLMGGRTGVQSTLGKGSVFWFEMPLRPAPPSPAPPTTWLQQKEVAIIESHAGVRASLKQLLRSRFQCTVLEFPDGGSCIAALQARAWPHLLIAAQRMADMDARQLLVALQRQAPSRYMVRWISAWPLDFDTAKALTDVGADRLLEKPLGLIALQRASQQQGALSADPPPPPRGEAGGPIRPRKRLLIVDDNALNRAVAAELIDAQPALQADTDLAENGHQALAAIAAAPRPYDAIFMDLQMPAMDGYSASRAIRKIAGYETVPIFALSAHRGEAERAAALDAGMTDFVHKPIVEQALREVLVRHRLITVDQQPAEDSPATAREGTREVPAAATMDIHAWHELCTALPKERAQALAHAFIRQSRGLLTDCLHALEAGQRDAAIAALHKLAGTAGTFGLGTLGHQVEALENALKADISLAALQPDMGQLQSDMEAGLQALSRLLETDAQSAPSQ
ncbi:hybrid sensor histidine kinase/response regulator [Lampropedia cohaerens]|uniref:hybrid sensor histidine kinase/response regulator n=1 Tax=Lampropedia cohaerens TaxID=1610491 RepID=UPI00069AFB1B|nr:response regulator [Lampropedia cohaerens]